MRSMVLAVTTALALSVVAFAQNGQSTLPKCLQDAAPFNVDVREVAVAKVLPFLGAVAASRFESRTSKAPRTVPRV